MKGRSPEFEEVKRHLQRAHKELKTALKTLTDLDVDPQEYFGFDSWECLRRDLLATRETVELFDATLKDRSIEVDRQLFAIQQYRQWGEFCMQCYEPWRGEPGEHLCSCVE